MADDGCETSRSMYVLVPCRCGVIGWQSEPIPSDADHVSAEPLRPHVQVVGPRTRAAW
jgi:hypothetical protein